MPNSPPPPPRLPSREEAEALRRKIDSELSPEERDLLYAAGRKFRFWTNVGAVSGLVLFALPLYRRPNPSPMVRLTQTLIGGTVGVVLFTPIGALYGMQRARTVVMTHPNHEHLVKVLERNRREWTSGRSLDRGQTGNEASDQTQTESWSSERQDPFSSTPNSSNESFDEDTLLTDEEINRQNQGATFTPPNSDSQDQEKPQSAWDALRARAAQQKPPQQKKEKNIWGEDK